MSYDILSATDGSKYLSKGDALPGLNKKARYNSESDFMYNRGSMLLPCISTHSAKLSN